VPPLGAYEHDVDGPLGAPAAVIGNLAPAGRRDDPTGDAPGGSCCWLQKCQI